MPVTSAAFVPFEERAVAGLIDGRVLIYDLVNKTLFRTLTFAPTALAGVLHEVRFSPSATYVAAWGFQLGVRVWQVQSGKALWTLGASAPAGAMDVVLMETPQQVRLAVPDAPLALADDDPFRWAHEGRRGSSILTRPFTGPPVARWTQPIQVVESRGMRGAAVDDWFVHQRILARDGSHLLTLSTQRGGGETRKGLVRLWEVEHRGAFGSPRPRQIAHMDCPAGGQWYPLTTTPDLRIVGLGHIGRSMHVLHFESRHHVRIETGPIPSESRAALSPDGAYLALARGTTLDVWNARTAAPQARWEFAAEITSINFSGDQAGPALGVGLANGLLDVWR
jgi:hypothetical protein